MSAKDESMPLVLNSAAFATMDLKRLMLSPPHKPLSVETTIKQAF